MKHLFLLLIIFLFPYDSNPQALSQEKIQRSFHRISSHDLLDYAGIDAKEKIVVMETGLPYTKNDSLRAERTPCAYHRYKFENARNHGAAGLLYVSKVANPNTSHLNDFIYAHIDVPVAELMFAVFGIHFHILNEEKFIKNVQRGVSCLLPKSKEIFLKWIQTEINWGIGKALFPLWSTSFCLG